MRNGSNGGRSRVRFASIDVHLPWSWSSFAFSAQTKAGLEALVGVDVGRVEDHDVRRVLEQACGPGRASALQAARRAAGRAGARALPMPTADEVLECG
jgi:hypothetical protein